MSRANCSLLQNSKQNSSNQIITGLNLVSVFGFMLLYAVRWNIDSLDVWGKQWHDKNLAISSLREDFSSCKNCIPLWKSYLACKLTVLGLFSNSSIARLRTVGSRVRRPDISILSVSIIRRPLRCWSYVGRGNYQGFICKALLSLPTIRR